MAKLYGIFIPYPNASIRIGVWCPKESISDIRFNKLSHFNTDEKFIDAHETTPLKIRHDI